VHRFHVPGVLDTGEFDLPADEARHLARVLRLRPGDTIGVFNGKGREWLARVESVGPRHVRVRAMEPRTPAVEPGVRVTLAQALLKSDKMDRVISDAVMLGVSAVRPFVSGRTDVPMKAVSGGGRHDRWQRTAVASAKQCGRAVVPPVHEVMTFEQVMTAVRGERRLMFVEPAIGRTVAELRSLESERPERVTIFIGPEGGWDPREASDASADDVALVSLGTTTLRADAAAAAVLAVLRYVWRDDERS
jgi:16S rRNA (uracil1498-N3)-methyltransferase